MKQQLRRIWAARIAGVSAPVIAILALVGASLAAAPLLRPAGYKAVTLTTLLASLVLPLIWLRMRRSGSSRALSQRSPVSAIGGFALLVGALFGGLFATSAVITEGCELQRGLQTLALLSLPGLFVAYALVELFAAAQPRHAWKLYILVWFLLCVLAGLWFLFEPVYQLTHVLAGMLLGPPNEGQPVLRGRVYWFAVERVAMGSAILVLAEGVSRGAGALRWPARIVGLTGALVAVVVVVKSPDLGHRIDGDRIRGDELSAHYQGGGLTHYMSPEIPSDARPWIVLEAEFQRQEQKELLGLGESTMPPAEIYWYRDAKQKRVLTGAKRTKFAKVHLGEFYVSVDSFPPRVVGHEMAHITSGRFSDNPLSVPGRLGGIWYNPALVEGFAVAVAWSDFPLSSHEQARIALDAGKMPPLSSLFSPTGFATTNLSVAYRASGSFIRFCMDEYGVDGVTKFFGSEDFEASFGVPLEVAESRWLEMLGKLKIPARESQRIKKIQARPSIAGEKCGSSPDQRALRASMKDEADEEVAAIIDRLTTRAVRPTDRAGLEVTHQLYLAERSGYRRELSEQPPAGASKENRQAWIEAFGLTCWANGQPQRAEEKLASLDDAYRPSDEVILARIMARDGLPFDHFDPPPTVDRVLLWTEGWRRTGHPVYPYRLSRLLWKRQRWRTLLEVSLAIDWSNTPFPGGEEGVIILATHQMRGLAAFAIGDFDQAERLWQEYLTVANTDGRRSFGHTWLRRTRFFRQHQDRLPNADLPPL